jgi:hypothetical protein
MNRRDLTTGKPSMLCYYFSFPAHEQSVGTDQCPYIEAKEAGLPRRRLAVLRDIA